MPRLTREQLESIFNESSSNKEEDEVFPTTIPEVWQLPTSWTDEYLRPTSVASSRYRPTTTLEDMTSEDEDSTKDKEERPLKEKEAPSPAEQGLEIQYSNDVL